MVRFLRFGKPCKRLIFKLNKRAYKKRRYLKNVLIRHLNSGVHCGHAKTQRTCLNLLSQGSSLWLFLDNPLVPATNNLAERQLRPLVIAKKLSFGVKSSRGARFIERAFSIVASCGQQKRNSLELFQKAFCSHFSGLAPPVFC
jgi:transposase